MRKSIGGILASAERDWGGVVSTGTMCVVSGRKDLEAMIEWF